MNNGEYHVVIRLMSVSKSVDTLFLINVNLIGALNQFKLTEKSIFEKLLGTVFNETSTDQMSYFLKRLLDCTFLKCFVLL